MRAPKSLSRLQIHLYEMTNRFSESERVLWGTVQQDPSANGGIQGIVRMQTTK